MGTFSLEDIAAGREASLRDAPECAMQMRGEGAARAERWLELGDGAGLDTATRVLKADGRVDRLDVVDVPYPRGG